MTSRSTTFAAAALGLAGGLLAIPAPAGAQEGDRRDRRIQIGDHVDDVELPTIDGRREHFLARGAKSNVFVFFRLEQERSLDTLKELASCEKDFAGKPVRFVGVVSDSFPANEVKAFVSESGVKMPILVDEGDALYGRLGIRLHPVIGIVDAKGKLIAYEPFRQINYCDRVRVRIRWSLGEASDADVARIDAPEPSITRTEGGVARRHLQLARQLHRIQQHDRALDEVRKSLGFAPSAEAYALEGQILVALRRCPDAVRSFDAALRLEPSNPAAKEGKRSCPP